MPLHDLHHIALRCKPQNLGPTVDFYTKVLGMKNATRPDLGFPGAWLDINDTMFHLLDIQPKEELDPWHTRPEAKSGFDHIAVKATGFDEMLGRVVASGADWRQLDLREFGIWQLFVLDPNGMIVEMNFTVSDEPPGSKGPDGTRPYVVIPEYADGTADGQNRSS